MNNTYNVMDIRDVQLHPLTKSNPPMTLEQYDAFKNNIKINGQQVPVILYRGKIIDGKHRYMALKDLGIPVIKYITLPNNFNLKQVQSIMLSTELRRHMTPTQLAIKGYRLYKTGMTQEKAVSIAGCSLSNMQNVVTLENLGRLDIIDLLEEGKKYNLSDDYHNPKMTDSLTAIVAKVKSEKKLQNKLQTISSDSKEDDTLTETEKATVDAVLSFCKLWSTKMRDRLYNSLINIKTEELNNKS